MQRRWSWERGAVLGALLLVFGLGACGEPELLPDAGTPDAGAPDAGTPDAGPGPAADLTEQLATIPGMTVSERVSTIPGARFFRLEYEQPVDHAHPGGQRFHQRMTLLHFSESAPMVLHTTGYAMATNARHEELARLLQANQLSIEHRYFDASRPQPTDWRHLTVRQAAADFHRVVQALRPLYPGRWLSAGASKGGETVVFHRRFYPEDVDGTLAYVAPLARESDARFATFLDGVGGDAWAACRERLVAFQRDVLTRREAVAQELAAQAAELRTSYTRLGYDKAVEHAAIEAGFVFWQQMGAETFCEMIPGAADGDHALYSFLDIVVDLDSFSDGFLAAYGPYFFQAGTELGYPQPLEAPLQDLLRYPGTDVPATYAPEGVSLSFDATAMQDVQDWVASQGERLMFVYGGRDPWGAAAYSLGAASDSHLYVAPDGNHGTRLESLPEPMQSEALDVLRGWAGLPSLQSVQRTHPPLLEAEPSMAGVRGL